MPDSTNNNASIAAGAHVDLAGGLDSASEKTQTKSTIDVAILASKSTATAVQEAKVMALLRNGPKTTMELREHGVMMPAARIHTLKHSHKHTISTELLPLYDRQGVRHSKCARYHLIVEAVSEVAK